MIFTSAIFLTHFLPIVLGLDWAAEAAGLRRLRWLALLVASLFFYAWWRLDHLPVLLGSIALNYVLGEKIAAASPSRSWSLLRLGIVANLLLLGLFKYTGFLAGNALWLLDVRGFQLPELALPLGISFFTFTQIAYLSDCAAGRRGHHGPVEYALFVTFFPHLLAGPIIHHSEMIPQFQKGHRSLDEAAADAAEGFALLAIGAAKKVILADGLSPAADAVFNGAAAGSMSDPGTAWLGALAYSLQLYFDFSGYSDMAVGLARLFGVRFPANFDSPYKAVDIVSFWRRWHMTLSHWLRNYLYIALGGNRGGSWRRYRNLLLTMLLGGLWHGAHWNFVIWGGLHGLALVVTHLVRQHLGYLAPRQPAGRLALATLSWAATFLFVVVAWVFFRATTTASALTILRDMGRAFAAPTELTPAFATPTGALIGVAASLAFLFPNSITIAKALEGRRAAGLAAGALAGVATLAAVLAALTSPTQSRFLYFNF